VCERARERDGEAERQSTALVAYTTCHSPASGEDEEQRAFKVLISFCLSMRVPHRPAGLGGPLTVANVHEASSSQQPYAYVGLRCDLLIPGRGSPIEDGALVIRSDKIEWVGQYTHRPPCYGAITFQHVPVLLPGLWDCHVHFGGFGLAFPTVLDRKTLLPGAQTLAGAVTVADLQRTLEAGVTSVRELLGVGSFCYQPD
jgi:hypothetical protein